MSKKLQPGDHRTLATLERTLRKLADIRQTFRDAGCAMAAKALTRAIKSADGAVRHYTRRVRSVPLLETCPHDGCCVPCSRHDDDDPCCLTHCEDCQEGVC